MEPQNMYRVRIWDNFHYMDEEEAFDHGTFETYEQALAAAKKIVEESVEEHGYDNAQYTMFGDDPGILCPPGASHPHFSAWDYAAELCKRHQSQANPDA